MSKRTGKMTTFIEETPEYNNNHYWFSMDGESDSECPVQQCTFKTTDQYKMRLHFRDCHIKDIIQIREEGLQPLPQCQKCGIFQNNVGLRHQQTVSCKKYTMRLALQNANEHNKKVAEEVKFTICGETMEQVKEFCYLGRGVSENNKSISTRSANFDVINIF